VSVTAQLLGAWCAVVVAGPVIGLLAGPQLRRALSRRVIQGLTAAAVLVMTMAFTPVSFAGVLVDHAVLVLAYLWIWILIGMLRSRTLRALFVGTPTLGVLLLAATKPEVFFLIFILSDLTATPRRTVAIDCGATTRSVRMSAYGSVASSGLEVTVSTRPRWVPVEVERGRRHFPDDQFSSDELNLFSFQTDTASGCTTVIAYDGHEVWRVK
jgi:hypothetical protein